MYNHKIVFEDQMFEADTWELPIVGDGAEVGDTGVRAGGQEGRLAVTIRAKTQCTLEAAKVLTLSLQESSDNGVADAFAAVAPAISIALTGPTGGQVFAAGEEMLSLLVPKGVERWLKASVTCTNVANADDGTIDVFLEYLAN